ncbi:MAG TPA: hypothetical protein PLL10_11020, partial [Elusimicrobiales bacterium]|nr:hypothetical protein [Elusimicrobiales bacterium]
MFRLKKQYPPFGRKDSPVIEASYAEGTVEVVDGLCAIRLPETRDRLSGPGQRDRLVAEQPERLRQRAARRRPAGAERERRRSEQPERSAVLQRAFQRVVRRVRPSRGARRAVWRALHRTTMRGGPAVMVPISAAAPKPALRNVPSTS